MGIKEDIQEQKELLYLNSLKVANDVLKNTEEGYEVSSGLLSASASLLKLDVSKVVVDSSSALDGLTTKLRGLVTDRDSTDV